MIHCTMLFKCKWQYNIPTEVTLMKLVEIKIIVTSINDLISPFRKKNPFHANILNKIVHNGLINPFIQNKKNSMRKTRMRLYA